ncbi:DUF2207 family protein [Enterococcus sp. AZ072]|uniref:DUF2207 family protein n=1 Tax=unclassified Enterococcus TaxID=2608891 RepID=UPI003D2A3208
MRKAAVTQLYTSKIVRWQRLERRIWLLPVGVGCYFLIYLLFTSSGQKMIQPIALPKDWLIVLGLFLFYLCLSLVLILPLMILFKWFVHTGKKKALENAAIPVLTYLPYFRETFPQLTPAMISLLTDLELEVEKDVAASLLFYQFLEVVTIDDQGNIRLLTLEHPQLQGSDRILLKKLVQGKIDKETLNRWEKQATQEAIDAGYIKSSLPSVEKKLSSGVFSGCLLPSILLVSIGLAARESFISTKLIEFQELISHAPEENVALMLLFFSDPQKLGLLGLILGLGLMAFLAFFLPVGTIIQCSIKKKNQNKYVRTLKGEALTEQLYGMKRFLHDFSELSYAQKEQLILWEEFLIYAVVLEENQQIVDELTALYFQKKMK